MKRYREASDVDMSTWYALMFSNVVCLVSFYVAFFVGRSKAKSISDVFAKIKEAGDIRTNNIQAPLGKVTKREMRSYVLMLTFTSLVSLVIFLFYFNAFLQDILLSVADIDQDTCLSWLSLIFSSISFTLTHLNPITRGFSVLSIYMIGCAGECFDRVKEALLLREGQEKKKALSRSAMAPYRGEEGNQRNPPPSYREIVARGRLCDQVVEDLNATLSPLILFMYSIYLFLVTIYSYMTLVPLLIGSVERVLSLMSAFSFFLLLLHTMSLYYLCCSGQELQEKRKAARYCCT